MRRLILTISLVALPARLLAQEQVVTPTYVHEHQCTQMVPCDPVPLPCPQTPTTTPCTPAAPPVIHYEMRSKALFWGGVGLVAGGATLVIASMTWARDSEATSYVSLPCGTDPYFALRTPIAPCIVSRPLLGAGAAMAGSGAALMFLGGEKVAVGSDGRQVTVRVRF